MSTTKNTYTAEAPTASAPETNDPNSAEISNAVKDLAIWTTGDEEMTGAQKSYLKTLFNHARSR